MLVFQDVTRAFCLVLNFYPLGQLLGFIALVLIFIFLVTSADSGGVVLSMMTSGGTDSVQDEIAAEMLATLAEDAGIPVTRRIGFGSTRLTLATVRRGDIGIYPEYTGSGLAMLGLSLMSDPDAALQLLRERLPRCRPGAFSGNRAGARSVGKFS